MLATQLMLIAKAMWKGTTSYQGGVKGHFPASGWHQKGQKGKNQNHNQSVRFNKFTAHTFFALKAIVPVQDASHWTNYLTGLGFFPLFLRWLVVLWVRYQCRIEGWSHRVKFLDSKVASEANRREPVNRPTPPCANFARKAVWKVLLVV